MNVSPLSIFNCLIERERLGNHYIPFLESRIAHQKFHYSLLKRQVTCLDVRYPFAVIIQNSFKLSLWDLRIGVVKNEMECHALANRIKIIEDKIVAISDTSIQLFQLPSLKWLTTIQTTRNLSQYCLMNEKIYSLEEREFTIGEWDFNGHSLRNIYSKTNWKGQRIKNHQDLMTCSNHLIHIEGNFIVFHFLERNLHFYMPKIEINVEGEEEIILTKKEIFNGWLLLGLKGNIFPKIHLGLINIQDHTLSAKKIQTAGIEEISAIIANDNWIFTGHVSGHVMAHRWDEDTSFTLEKNVFPITELILKNNILISISFDQVQSHLYIYELNDRKLLTKLMFNKVDQCFFEEGKLMILTEGDVKIYDFLSS